MPDTVIEDGVDSDERGDISILGAGTSISTRQTPSCKDNKEGCNHRDEHFHPGTSNIVVIDDGGDLYMKLSDGMLRVSRKAMTLSSPVFLAMLGAQSRFAEAKQKLYTLDGLQVVDFPDDSFAEMVIAARIIHLQHNQVPRALTFQQLYQMAVLCDKYDLNRSLGLWPKEWTEPWLNWYAVEGYEGCLIIAKAFQLSGLYKATTRHLILNAVYDERSGGILINNPDVSAHASLNVLNQIRERRATAMFYLASICWEEYDSLRYSNCTRECKITDGRQHICDAINLGFLHQTFPEIAEPDALAWEARDALSLQAYAKDMEEKLGGGAGICCVSEEHQACAVGHRIINEANEVLNELNGLELPGTL